MPNTLIAIDFGEFSTWLLIVRLCLIAILTLFILLSGFLLPMYLRGLQEQELARIRGIFAAIRHTAAFTQAESAAPSFRVVDYLTPVLFTAFIVMVFATVSMFGGHVTALSDFILGGTQLWNGDNGNKQSTDFLRTYEEGTLAIIIFAFFGSFIWSVQYILGRVMTRDVSPGEFYKIAINMIFAIILAVAIRHSLSALVGVATVSKAMESALPTVGFLIGLFPNFFLEWLVKRVQGKWFGKDDRADALELKQIEGLSDTAIFRLTDLELNNAENLACANPVTIYMRTRFGLAEAVDWVAQALLLTLFKFDRTAVLRSFGIRTIADLVCQVGAAAEDSLVLTNLAGALGLTPQGLKAIVECARADPAYLRLMELRTALSEPPTAQMQT